MTRNLYVYTGLMTPDRCTVFWPVLRSAIVQDVMKVLIVCESRHEVMSIQRLLVQSGVTALPRIVTLLEYVRSIEVDVVSGDDRFRPLAVRLALQAYHSSGATWFDRVVGFSGFADHLDRFLHLAETYGLDEETFCRVHPMGREESLQFLELVGYVRSRLAEYHLGVEGLSPRAVQMMADTLADMTVVTFGFSTPSCQAKAVVSSMFEHAQLSMVWMPCDPGKVPDFIVNSAHFVREIRSEWDAGMACPSVHLYESEEDELTAISGFVQDLYRQHGASILSHIWIVEASNREAKIEDRLVADGMSVSTASRRMVSATMLGHFILQFLELAMGRGDSRTVVRFLSEPIWKFSPWKLGVRTVFLSVTNQFNVTSGNDEWMRALDLYIDQLTALQRESTGRDYAEPLRLAMEVKPFFVQLFSTVDSLKRVTSAREVMGVFHQLIMAWFWEGMSSSLDTVASRQREFEAMEVMAFFKQACAQFDALSGHSFSLTSFFKGMSGVFSKSVAQYFEGDRPEGVRVVDIMQTPVFVPQFVWISGLAQDVFPGANSSNIFCPVSIFGELGWPTSEDADARALSQLGCWMRFSDLTCRLSVATHSFGEEASLSPIVAMAFRQVTAYSDPPIVRPLPMEGARVFRDRPEWHSGPIVGEDAVAKAFVRQYFEGRSMSVTSLEMYQTCPFKYYMTYLLKMAPIEKVVDGVNSAIWGQVVHEIFQRYYEAIMPDCHHDRAVLYRVAEDVFSRMSQPTFYWMVKRDILFGHDGLPQNTPSARFSNGSTTPASLRSRLLGSPRPSINRTSGAFCDSPNESKMGLLEAFLAHEDQNPFPLTPIAFEHAFKQLEMTLDDNTRLFLSGKIDVLFANSDRSLTAVLDYKTGKTIPSYTDVECFRSLQLPIYQWVAERLYPQSTCVSGVIYQVHNSSNLDRKILSSTESAKKDLFELGKKRPFIIPSDYYAQLVSTLTQVVQTMRSGHFSTQPSPALAHAMSTRKAGCQYCDFQSTCRYSGRF